MRAVLDFLMVIFCLYNTININIIIMWIVDSLYSSIVCQMIYYVNFFLIHEKPNVHKTLVRRQYDLQFAIVD